MEKTVNLVKRYRRKEVEDLLKRKFFVVPAFEIYGGVVGLFDFGPLGSALKTNVEALWRNHFVLEDDMLELTCTSLTPEVVLKTSGHVDKFEDFMVKDMQNGQCHRADKLLEDHCEKILSKKKGKLSEEEALKLHHHIAKADSYSQEEIAQIFKELKIKSPDTGNELSEPVEFNLMFGTQIGPTGHNKGYFRPETAQGIFVAFKRLLEFNNGRVPFAAAQIGLGFRNEISPRAGLLRVREFTMAEIEHFYDPQTKTHPRFSEIADEKLFLFSKECQLEVKDPIADLTVGEAVAQKIIDNEILAYYMVRSWKFFTSCGIPPHAIRYRQHLDTEMAHYASDCWDAEIETSYGWIEVAGHADRSCYDLKVHSEATNTDLVAARPLETPIEKTEILLNINRKEIGKKFKKESKVLNDFLAGLTDEQKETLMNDFQNNGGANTINVGESSFELDESHITFTTQTKKIMEEKFLPSVIEPSFGIGRTIYCIFEHCFRAREDASRTYFNFPPLIAPVKTSLLPLISNDESLIAKIRELSKQPLLTLQRPSSERTVSPPRSTILLRLLVEDMLELTNVVFLSLSLLISTLRRTTLSLSESSTP